MRETGGTADGVLRLLNRMSDEYGELIAAFRRMSLPEFKAWEKNYLEHASMLTRQLFPAVDKVAEKEQALLASRTKLAAALAARRAELKK